MKENDKKILMLPSMWLIFIIPFLSFFIAVKSIQTYGVNWDTYQHLVRGQVYLRYILTGKRNSDDILPVCFEPRNSVNPNRNRTCPLSVTPRISYFEKSQLDMDWGDKLTIGHPPVMDVVMAIVNKILFVQFGMLDDISSYNIVPVFFTLLLACIVALWAYEVGGLLPSIISSIALVTYPLLLAEQHFNIKDPTLTSLITITAYLIYKSVHTEKVKYLLFSAIPFALAFGTKFNIIFLPINCIPWLIVQLSTTRISMLRHWKRWLFVIFIIIGISFLLFYTFFPSIWSKPIQGFRAVVEYYQQISNVGKTPCVYPIFTGSWFLCSTVQPFVLFFTTIFPSTLFLGAVGVISTFKKFSFKNGVYLLWICLFIAPLGRSVLPLMSLYGGSLRQIMEYYPFFALFAGVGGAFVIRRIQEKKYLLFSLVMLVSFFLSLKTLFYLHPYENVYYNEFVGGISGAKIAGLPLVGNTYGSAYKELLDWLNHNAPANAKFATLVSIGSSFPSYYIRPDISYLADGNDLQSVGGEYLLELALPGMTIDHLYRVRYAKNFLQPVFEIVRDGIVIGSIWRNSPEDRSLWSRQITTIPSSQSYEYINSIDIAIEKSAKLAHLDMKSLNTECLIALNGAVILIDQDGDWERMEEPVGYFNSYLPSSSPKRQYEFTGEKTQKIRVTLPDSTCNLTDVQFDLSIFSSEM